MPQVVDASSMKLDSISQNWEEEAPSLSEISDNDDVATDNRIPKLCSAAEQAFNVKIALFTVLFNPDEYLQAFYSTPTNDTAMHTILFFLPGILYWIPEKIRTLLDLGAGPTVYVPITFRKRAEHIYSADYAENSCDMLKNWVENKSSFEWTEICKWIASIEDSDESPAMMEQSARSRFEAILRADLHDEPIIKCVYYKSPNANDIPKQFHVVVSIFCLEYSSENLEDYRRAVRSAVNLIEPNGYLIQGGVLQANDYYFGNRRYKCHHLRKEEVIESLKENNMTTEKDGNFKWFEFDEVFLLIARKKG
uniref:NNMT/PNMT/TEMT family protein n=1 Tax=Setaria digitata TaxID=48799 RepID=A0A915PFF7_9BILA